MTKFNNSRRIPKLNVGTKTSRIRRRTPSRHSPSTSTTSATTVSNYSVKSGKIFRGFYSTMRQFFPTLNEQSFSLVFTRFITTPDFTEFLKTVPELKGMPSKPEMNLVMVEVAAEIASKVKNEPIGSKIKNGGRSGRLQRRDPMTDINNELTVMYWSLIYICINLICLRRRPIHAVFYIALIIFYFWSLLQHSGPEEPANRLLATRVLPAATIIGGPPGVYLIRLIFGCLRRLVSRSDDDDDDFYRHDRFVENYNYNRIQNRSPSPSPPE